jgi:type II secretory pathway pseudopilin PulG
MRVRSGFTLLEAAVAMTIVTFVTVGAMGAFGADMRAADRARQLLPASALASERIAVLELADPLTLRALPDSLARGTFAAPLDAYTWVAAAREVRGEAGLMELTVRVTWRDGEFGLAQRRYRPLPSFTSSLR